MNTVRDGRQRPFFQVVKEDIRAIEEACGAPEVTVKLSAVRSTYFALLEFANDDRADETNVTRKALAEKAGVSSRTSQEATAVLEAAGVLAIEERRGSASTGNVWVLLDAPNRQPPPVQTGAHCLTNRRPLPVSIYNGQEGEETPLPPEGGTADNAGLIWERFVAMRERSPKQLRNKTLDRQTRRMIERALAVGDVDEWLKGVDAILNSTHHVGENDRQTKYLDPRHIFTACTHGTVRQHLDWLLDLPVAGEKVDPVIRQARLDVVQAFQMPNSVGARAQGAAAEKLLAAHGWQVVLADGEHPRFVPPTSMQTAQK